MALEEQDKTDPASAYKLQKARERGSVAKSQDLSFLVILFGTTCCVFGLGANITRDLANVMRAAMGQMQRGQWDVATTSQVLGQIATETLTVLAMPLAMVMVLAVLAGLVQVGFTMSAEPLKPDFSRINPAEGFKRLFSMRTIYELGRSSIKLLAAALLVALASGALLREVVVLSHREVPSILSYMIHAVGEILAALTALFALLAAADVAYTRYEFMKKMRMSRREVKDEHKQREGDPRIKSRIRELRLQWLKKGMALRRVKDADVLVTNPTHYAVAIGYKRGLMPAPRILAKGAGDLAARMRELAGQHGVMIVQNPVLARSLYRLAEPDDWLPQQHYAEVAKLLIWVYAARDLRAGKGRATGEKN